MPNLYCSPDEQIIEIRKTETILRALLSRGIPHTHVCGGEARCSTCRVLVTEGVENCSPRTPTEQTLAQKLGMPSNMRLACQTKVNGDVAVRRMVLDSEDIEIVRDQVKLGSIGEEKFVAIMFSDIRGFTKFAEEMLPYDVIYVLNRFFQSMGQVIQKYDGVINNYMGDGFMALFGLDDPKTASQRAVSAAVDMLIALEELNAHLEPLYHRPLKIGIGIHYGWTVLGAVGASKNKRITAIGDCVNLASRIESANKQLGTSILISQNVYDHVKETVVVNNCSHQVDIIGKSGKYQLYEVIDMKVKGPYSSYKPPYQNFSTSIFTLFNYLASKFKEFYSKFRQG